MLLKLARFDSNPASYYVQNNSIQQKFEREFEAIPSYQILEILSKRILMREIRLLGSVFKEEHFISPFIFWLCCSLLGKKDLWEASPL